MTQKQTKHQNLKTWQLIVIGIFTVPVVFVLVLLLVNLTEPDYSNSQQNIDLMQKAAMKHDETICNQIKGGVMPPKHGMFDDFNGYSDMNESEAKARCRSQANGEYQFRDHVG